MKCQNILLKAQTIHSQNYDSGLMERLLFRVAKKWVAGYSADDAVSAALESNRRGMSAIINFLGEDTTDAKQVDLAVNEYLLLMDQIHKKGVRGCVSVKPTQLGLALDYDLCLQNFRRLVDKARTLKQFLWIDMESVQFTEDTITIYLELLKEYGVTGVAIQAYLRRSGGDLLHILEHGGKVRLVKGAYHELEEHAFASKEEVDQNYLHLMKMAFESGNSFAVATHDSSLIDEAIRMKNGKFEFQMLMGIRDELKNQLVASNFPVSEYIPYGSQWLPYSVRRIRERKRNLLLLARSLVG
jgi:proline dehydrogenase